MPQHTTHTFFGDPQRPLFGALHLPPNNQARGGVVICPPLGKEQADTVRGQRLLAEGLATLGLATLRFDYLHTGESWGEQDDPKAAALLTESVREALAFLKQTGLNEVALVGLRAASLAIGELKKDELDAISAVVLWEPVAKGSTYLRAEKLNYRAGLHDDAVDGEEVHLVGASWHREAADQLRQFGREPQITEHLGGRLAVAATDTTSPQIAPLVGQDTTVIATDDAAGFVTPNSFYVELPTDAVHRIAGWLDEQFGAATLECAVEQVTTAVMGHRPDGTEIVTRLDAHSNGIVRWITEPVGMVDRVLLVHSTANDIRTGPSRSWVDLGRELARTQSVRSIRYDRPGVGENGAVDPEDDYVPLYSDESVEAARQALGNEVLPVVHAGVCSGGWVAARMAWERRTDGVVLVNQLTWDLTPKVFSRDDLIDMGINAKPLSEGESTSESWFYRYRARLQPIVSKILPFWAWRLLGRLQLAHVPDLLLNKLARRKIDTALVFSEEDFELFSRQRGDKSLTRLARHHWQPEVIVVDGGDHAGLHWRVRQGAATACRDALARVQPPAK